MNVTVGEVVWFASTLVGLVAALLLAREGRKDREVARPAILTDPLRWYVARTGYRTDLAIAGIQWAVFCLTIRALIVPTPVASQWAIALQFQFALAEIFVVFERVKALTLRRDYIRNGIEALAADLLDEAKR